ncbi:MAG: tetratricopeptide repeat protein [Pseudomonadota bacterium]|nr:tetratricopeptide repeat protein [Pseudomonadota bacterium]
MISGSPAQTPSVIPAPVAKIAPYFFLLLVVCAAYGNVYDNAFLYDDESLILKNAYLRDWHAIGSIFRTSATAGASIAGGFYRPMQILAYLIIYQLAGLSLFMFHALNVALHASNACLVYALGRKLRFKIWPAFFAALVWALHPVHTEVIAYISGTADPLYAFFTLLGLIMLLPRFSSSNVAASLPFFALALLSKEEAVAFPLLAMSCAFLLSKEPFKPKTYYSLWPLWLLAAGYVVWHQFGLNFSDFQLHRQNDLYANSVLVRTYTFLATVPSYLGFVVWPVGLHFDRDFPAVQSPLQWRVGLGLLLVALATAQICLGRKRKSRVLSWGWLWFAAADILHTGILVAVNASLLEHWLYLPTAGLFLAVAQRLDLATRLRGTGARSLMAVLAGTAALLLGVLTYEQNNVWHDAETLYLNIFRNGEPSPHAHNNLAIEYTRRGEYQLALEHYELSIELSGDTNAEAQHDLAITLLNGPDGNRYTQEAIRHFLRAVEIDPSYYPSYAALEAMYERMGDRKTAALYRQKAAEARQKLTASP